MPYEHLKLWNHPDCYLGATWEGWYSAGVGQSRDSDALERANFEAMKQALFALPEHTIDLGECGPDNDGPGLQVVREGHWAVGWVEWIAIHQTNTRALEVANNICAKLEDYPVIDEELWSRFEDEDCAQTWENCYDERERLEYLKKHGGSSLKYGAFGESVYRSVRKAIKGDWSYAANLLPCPSDLIA